MTTAYNFDQYGVIRTEEGVIVPQDEASPLYVAYALWLRAGGLLTSIIAEPQKPLLAEYKLLAKQGIATKADAFVDRLTAVAGIPRSELANFEAKAQAALDYKYEGKAIPLYSAIYQEARVTGETPADLCDKIIERFQQREHINGLISGMRRTAGWAIDAAPDHASVDLAVAGILAQAQKVFGGYAL